jgi:hypothetical protein
MAMILPESLRLIERFGQFQHSAVVPHEQAIAIATLDA